jgi:hypothetical protein
MPELTTWMTARRGSALSDSLGFVIRYHSYDYISFLVPFVDIPVSLDDLFQRIASIYDRF